MEDLGPRPERLGERGQPGGDEHELLDVEPVVGVRAAVDHVHERQGQRSRVRSAEVAEEREPDVVGRGAGAGQRHAENRVGAQRLLWGVPSSWQSARSIRRLVAGVHPHDLGRDRRARRCARPAARPCRRSAARSPSRSSSASALPVEAPEGTAARPSAPRRGGPRPRGSGCRGSRGSRGRGRRRSRPRGSGFSGPSDEVAQRAERLRGGPSGARAACASRVSAAARALDAASPWRPG